MKIPTLLLLLCACAAQSHADAALLVEEPFGGYGWINPTGHAAVYLTRVCAASPTELRRCTPGEQGVVISRYHKIAGRDWIAIPLIPYLYAVEQAKDVPFLVTAEQVGALRDSYRRKYLRELIPDGKEGAIPKGEWIQLIGSAYDRRLYGFEIETSPEQDDALIARLNSRPNRSHFNLFFHNCADFSRGILNFYHPKALRRSFVADAAITTPKHDAKSLVKYAKKHPKLQFSVFEIRQVAGLHRSDPIYGVMESVVKSKKYVVPLAIFEPWIGGSVAVAYLSGGSRFSPRQYVESSFEAKDLEHERLTLQALAEQKYQAAQGTSIAARGGSALFKRRPEAAPLR